MKKQIKKLIKDFEKKHKKVYEEGDSDCNIIENKIHRTAPLKDWLGTKEEWEKSKKEEKERDKYVRCYICEFIKELKQFLKIKKT